MNVEMKIDGEDLDINDFVQKITFEINKALISSLNAKQDWSTIEIKLEK